MYDGIHYDPMGLVEKDGGQIIKTVFPTDDASFQAMALQVADELKKVWNNSFIADICIYFKYITNIL